MVIANDLCSLTWQGEGVICQHPAVREAAVFGVLDPQWGEIVMACVVLKLGTTLTADDLIAYCRQTLANYKVPGESSSLKLSYPGAAPARYSKEFCVSAFGRITSGRSVEDAHCAIVEANGSGLPGT